MNDSLADFWKLAIRSQVLTAEACQQLEAEFAGVKGAANQSNAATLGQWLVARGMLSGFQVKTLLKGRPGPFVYGDYCVYDKIRSKEGRLAQRFRAVHLATRHPVLLHFFADSSAAAIEPEVWEGLLREIAWACWVGSPYVAQCYQTVDLGTIKLVAIENLAGDTLATHLTGGRRFAPADACRLAREAALGLAQMHQVGRAHGQLLPANFWLDISGTLKLLQFPLAGDVAAGPGPIDWNAPDQDGRLLTTADYAAPELYQPGRAADPLTDIYALGAVLYQVLSGWPPFPGGDLASKYARHAAEPVASLAAVVPELLAQVVAYLLAKDPAQRYQSAAQVAEALAYFVDPALLNMVPAASPTAAPFDQWLEQQTRVPGMTPGSIPTATQWAAYSAAQQSAAPVDVAQQQAVYEPPAAQAAVGPNVAEQAAAQQAAYEQAAALHYADEQAAAQRAAAEQAAAEQAAAQQTAAQQAAAGFGSAYAPGFASVSVAPAAQYSPPEIAPPPVPAENGGGFFESLQPDYLQFDPLAATPAGAEQSHYADFSVAGPAASAPDPFAGGGYGFAAPAVAEPPAVAPGQEYGGLDFPAAAPRVENFVSPIAAAATAPSVAPKAAGVSKPGAQPDAPLPASDAAVHRKSARARNDKVILAVFGGVVAVLLLVGGIVINKALNTSGPSDETQVADNGGGKPPDKRIGPPPTANPGGHTGTDQPPDKQNPTGPDKGSHGDGGKTAGTGDKGPPTAGGPTDSGPPKVTVEKVADDGASLWASPTAGSPLPLAYIASGPQVILSVRPRQMISRPDADQLLPALGPWGELAKGALKQVTGFELNQIDRVTATMNDSGTGQLAPTFVIRTDEKMAADTLLAAWGKPATAREGSETFYQGAIWSFYLPPNEGGKVLVVAPAAQIKDVIQAAGAGPTMSRYLEAIVASADADRDVNLLLAPPYLLTDGQAFFSGPLAPLQTPFGNFFGDDARAAIVSLHFQGAFFVELRVLGPAEKDLDSLSSLFASRVRQISGNVENNLDALNLHPYDRKLLRRFPEWMRTLGDFTRNGTEDGQAVLRCYLPSVAAHNVLMASELALAEQGHGGSAVTGGGPAKPQTVAELLKKKTTLAFPRDTLERSLQLLFDDVGVRFEILGGDLQLEGITKNQSFGLDEKDKPAGEILRKIMTLANPDGKLIYVIKPKAPGGPEMVFITTRASAAKRGDKLPPELQLPAKPGKKKS